MIPDQHRVAFVLQADDEEGTRRPPLRLALEWDRRSEERLVGLGARHGLQLDQSGRAVQLGADRRYTGPDCPPDLLAQGGIPQGDCAPMPWMLSSRGYAALVETEANGTRFDLAGQRISVSTRAGAGPLRVQLLCDRTPAARLRHLCRLSGFPQLVPEWGYGFWKSRDVYEHQDDVIEDFDGFRRNGIPLDAIVIDSPWETQYNTWKFYPHQFPDARGMISTMRADGVRTVVWVTPWVNLDSRDGQIPPQAGSERLHREPAPNYAPAAAAGHFVREPDGEPFVTQWWMGTGSPVDFTSRAADDWWRQQAKQVLALGVEGIKADDGEGYYIPDRVRLADGRSGAEGRGRSAAFTAAACSARWTRSTPGAACCSAAADGPASRRRASRGEAIRRRTSGRCGRWSGRRSAPRAAASRTGPTTSAATSDTGSWSAASPSCWSGGFSSAASRR